MNTTNYGSMPPEQRAAFDENFPPEIDLPKGVTLRDYFAGQAIAGLSAYAAQVIDQIAPDKRPRAFALAASTAYEIAAAMMRERERK